VWISSLSPLKYPPLENLFADVATILEKKNLGERGAKGERREKREKRNARKVI